jgi:hypothetical protein
MAIEVGRVKLVGSYLLGDVDVLLATEACKNQAFSRCLVIGDDKVSWENDLDDYRVHGDYLGNREDDKYHSYDPDLSSAKVGVHRRNDSHSRQIFGNCLQMRTGGLGGNRCLPLV